jgi:GNAT superfamily N-acetyltransferase
MFWKGRVSNMKQIELFLKQSDVQLIDLGEPQIPENIVSGCKVSVSKLTDTEGISKLLNDWFEEPDSRSKAHTTPEWIRSSFLKNHAIWIVAKDKGGTIRGCISSFLCKAPFPNSLSNTCGKPYPWGIVDWYCVHPLWRSKGLGSALLETLDYITYKIGRRAHIFLKEGYPLPFPHIPIYSTWLKCRKAGSNMVKHMSEDTGLVIELYHEIERETGIPLIKVEGLTSKLSLNEWEDALDKLPECWVFVSGDCYIDDKRGWKTDSFISMYAFRWSPGRCLGSRPFNI